MKRTNRPTKPLVNTEELGRAVRRRREELGLSLRDVATRTSVSASTLSRIENGTGKPDADNIARLTSWLDVPMERILRARGTTKAAPPLFTSAERRRDCRSPLRADRNLNTGNSRRASKYPVANTSSRGAPRKEVEEEALSTLETESLYMMQLGPNSR